MSDEALPSVTLPAAAPAQRYNFSGHVIGAAAQFHKLNEKSFETLIQVPSLGASVLSKIGGHSVSEVSHYCFEVQEPKRRKLLSVDRIRSFVEGSTRGTEFRTVTESDIESITFVDKLHIDLVRFRMTAIREGLQGPTKVTTEGNLIQGIHIGGAELRVELDDCLLPLFATKKHIEDCLKSGNGYEAKVKNSNGIYHFNLVKSIEIVNRAQEKNKIEQISANAVKWDGFGTIFFGEATVQGDDRQMTLVRLQMGSDAGGSGTVGDGHSNGSAGSS